MSSDEGSSSSNLSPEAGCSEWLPPRGRGKKRRGRGRGGTRATSQSRTSRGGRGRSSVGRSDEEQQRLHALRAARTEETERQLQDLTLDEWRELGRGLFERQPGLVFDALMMHQNRHGAPPAAGPEGLPWCVCSNCREMPTDLERKCCGVAPPLCISKQPSFALYCLEAEILRIHRNYREDITALGIAREPGDDNREYRFAAYRSFIYWQHGAVGQRNRLVIPSCCVWQIRDKWPDPLGSYTGFIPGH